MKQSHGEKTKERILKAGIQLWPYLTLQGVAYLTGISKPAVFYHFPDGSLKNAVADYAVQVGVSKVVVQLIAAKHSAIKTMSPSERCRHFKAI